MIFDEWLAAFGQGKKEVPSSELGTYAVHTIRRFIDGKKGIWEIAFTYTGRLVVRSGFIEPDGITIKWEDWNTRHDVEIPKGR